MGTTGLRIAACVNVSQDTNFVSFKNNLEICRRKTENDSSGRFSCSVSGKKKKDFKIQFKNSNFNLLN